MNPFCSCVERFCLLACMHALRTSVAQEASHGLLTAFCHLLPALSSFLQFFAEQGWSMLVRHSWRQAAGKYGWEPQVAAGSEGRPPSQEVQFSVSVVAK
jgi:hypothetical protein